MTFPTDLTETTPTGHRAAHNALHRAVNVGAFETEWAGDYPHVINVQNPPAAVSAVAALGDANDDSVALQTIFDWLEGSRAYNHVVWFPYFRSDAQQIAVYRTSVPLRVWTGTTLKGPALIQPSDGFDWGQTHPHAGHPLYNASHANAPALALIELWNETNGRGAFSRLFIDDIQIDCRGQAGSAGLMTKYAQPGWTHKLRIDYADLGWWLAGQESRHEGFMSFGCDVALRLGGDDAKFMSFDMFNVEEFTSAAVLQDFTVGGGRKGTNWFRDVHLEANGAEWGSAIGFDVRAGGITVENGWATMGQDGQKIFSFADDGFHWYHIKDFTLAVANVNQVFLEDLERGYTRMVGNQRHLDEVRGLYQDDTATDFDDSLTYLGRAGGFVKIGGVGDFTPAAAQLSLQAEPNQSGRIVKYFDGAGTLRAGVHQSGNYVLSSYNNTTRPTASTVEAGTTIWNTDDNAPNFSDGTNWRDAAGTVT